MLGGRKGVRIDSFSSAEHGSSAVTADKELLILAPAAAIAVERRVPGQHAPASVARLMEAVVAEGTARWCEVRLAEDLAEDRVAEDLDRARAPVLRAARWLWRW